MEWAGSHPQLPLGTHTTHRDKQGHASLANSWL